MVNSLTDRRKAPYGDQLVATGGVFLYATCYLIPKQFVNIIFKILSVPWKIYKLYKKSQNSIGYSFNSRLFY